jgi:hypothetical protein
MTRITRRCGGSSTRRAARRTDGSAPARRRVATATTSLTQQRPQGGGPSLESVASFAPTCAPRETAAIIISFVIAVAIAAAQSMLAVSANMARRSRPQHN